QFNNQYPIKNIQYPCEDLLGYWIWGVAYWILNLFVIIRVFIKSIALLPSVYESPSKKPEWF
ncbi:hypothetical protein KKF63_06005, partial [bacterium]|nr:hypothetical protein [bacterium]